MTKMATQIAPRSETLYYGDCLDWMKQWPAECVDLVYLDPPFNSDENYNLLYGGGNGNGNGVSAQVRAFEDTWCWDGGAAQRWAVLKRAVAHPAHKMLTGLHMLLGESGMFAYVIYMTERLLEMHRLLKPAGAVYLHCDPTASHYLKAVMDGVFGALNFRNEIVWKRKQEAHNLASLRAGSAHDIIFWYAKSGATGYNRQFESYSEEYIEKNYKHEDKKGRYATFPCTNEAGGNRPYNFRGITRAWRFEKKRMQRMYKEGLLVQATTKSPFRYKKYLHDAEGVAVDDLWLDIKAVRGKREKLGYPTQKPLALLERIIKAGSSEGDVVLDPFCGCGTTIAAAAKLKRRWMGIDISPFTVDLIENRRLRPMGISPHVEGMPQDMAGARKLARDKPLDFEAWAVTRVPGLAPNQNKSGDGGIDGRAGLLNKLQDGRSLVLAQVKGGKFQISQFREFLHVLERENAAFGVYITLAQVTSPAAKRESAALGRVQIGAQNYPHVQFWTANDYFAGRKPELPPLADPFTGEARQELLWPGQKRP